MPMHISIENKLIIIIGKYFNQAILNYQESLKI